MKLLNFQFSFWRRVITILAKVFAVSIIGSMLVFLAQSLYSLGYTVGFNEAQSDAENYYISLIREAGLTVSRQEPSPVEVSADEVVVTPTPIRTVSRSYSADWGGPDLWEAVNKRRKELGVNPLSNQSELCTIASIRLNELLELGKLDAHEGFSNMIERRSDLEWIFDKFSSLAEFLALGGDSAEETVSLWENTLGHKKLLTGGEYVWGCIYAQSSFAVAITAY